MFNHARAERALTHIIAFSLGVWAAGGLAERYGERPVMQGLMPNGLMIEVWLNDETGTCTAMTVAPHGVACVQATCEGGRLIAAKPGAPS